MCCSVEMDQPGFLIRILFQKGARRSLARVAHQQSDFNVLRPLVNCEDVPKFNIEIFLGPLLREQRHHKSV